MPSQWLAVGAETDPLERARELQRSWERLLADGALALEPSPRATQGLRPTILESWRRSFATGLDPTNMLAPIEADESEVLERWFDHPLGSLADDLMDELRRVAEESRSMVVVTDASGLVLHRVGEEWLKERAAAEMNLVEGARYSEAADGTNGIGTALAAEHAFQVFAFEHYNERHHEWICSGAPVHDPVSGRVVGVVDLSSLWKLAHPRSLELVTRAARNLEGRLLELRRGQDARLRRRYGDLMTRSTDLLVTGDGYALAGAEAVRMTSIDIPDGGGEVVLGDGSVAVATALGQGEAYLLRLVTTHHARSAPVEVLERAERHVRELAAEQAALRHVATLVARESSPDRLFSAVAEQVSRVFDVPHVRLVRYVPDGFLVVGGFSDRDDEPFPVGSRWPADSPGVIATVRQTGRPARIEDYAHIDGEIAAVVRGAGMRSAVASPIAVGRGLWGATVILSPRLEPFPEDVEARLTDFTELVATAVANAESRTAVTRLADEQSALRRVATLVARGAAPRDLFDAVAREIGRLFPVGSATIGRYEPDGSVTTIASWSNGDAAVRAEELGSPIVVDGHLWGVITATSTEGALPSGTEARLASFTELVATAIANADGKAKLTASRRRIVTASDEARRRIERDLHDGVQQQLLALTFDLRLLKDAIGPDEELQAQIDRLLDGHEEVFASVVELSRGIHPAILSRGGLGPAVRTLARRATIPVALEVDVDGRLPTEVEVAAYFVVSEALANAAKYSQASRIDVSLVRRGSEVFLSVRDDGVGGADSAHGSGLVGLADRVEALGGSLEVRSERSHGTAVTARLPAILAP